MSYTRKEMNLRVFQRQPIPHVFFQPRFEPWLDWHRQFKSLPAYLQDKTIYEAYDDINASMRTIHYYTGQPDPIDVSYAPDVKITVKEPSLDRRRYFVETPLGTLTSEDHLTVDNTWRTIEFAAKGADDLPALKWFLARRKLTFNVGKFNAAAEVMGDRGVPQFWVPKSPYLALAQQWMRYEDFIYALNDQRTMVEDIMQVIDESYDALYEGLTGSGALNILNFGENIAMAYTSPRYYERYMLPWYEKRSGQLREAGIFTHVHIDGYFKGLLPYLASMPFDGLEALTPLPQGDVSLEEIKEHIGDKILLDGIPAIYFLSHYSREELFACVEKIVALFHPNLILGISDELPEGCSADGFERMREISEWCQAQP